MQVTVMKVGRRVSLAMSVGLAGIGPALAQTASPPATPAKESPKPATTAPAKPEEEHLKDATSLLGQDVHTPDGQRIGRIEDVLVDAAGHPRAVVVDFGGFMGIGSRKIAVAWDKMHFPPAGAKNQKITCDLTPDQIKAAPEYKEGKKPVTVTGGPPKSSPAPTAAPSPPSTAGAAAPTPPASSSAPPAPAPAAPPAPTPAPAASGSAKP
jgi:hypothetical protein